MKGNNVVIQISSGEKEVQKAILSQIKNLLKAMPGIGIELVIHSHGISFVLKESRWQKHLENFHQQGVSILVCKNTLDSLKLTKNELFSSTKVIPSAVAHLVKRQMEGWAYLKAGF